MEESMRVPEFDEVMRLTRTVSGIPACTELDARALYDCLCDVPRGGVVVETGCQIGRSSSLIAQMARAIGFHSIHIDPYCVEPPGVASPSVEYMQAWVTMMRNIGGEQEHEFTFLCMRTEQADWLLARLGPIDLAFIDGDHEYAGVWTDCKLVAERVRKGGWLTAHDFANDGLPGVKQGFGEYITDDKWESCGVSGSLVMWRRR